ncbi:tetratricopeptide repeat protein, partial [Stenotrophomonas maltophilia]|uniref:tetratricopeptide repeat protein n=1 Tax=Stenotrophomonas maltophilia TaxID=40324 RepID=UPI00195303F6
VEKQPAAPHLGRGLVYSQLGEFNLAVGDFTEAIQAGGNIGGRPHFYSPRASAYMKMKSIPQVLLDAD